MRICITGSSGKLAKSIINHLSDHHDIVGVTKSDLDVTDFEATKAKIAEIQPDVTIHAAAWTDVDGCARDPERAIEVNGLGSQNVAIASAVVDAAIVYVSSNEVFDGKLDRPYYEYDQRNPVNPYGYSKFYGEKAVASINPKHYICRTSWLFAHGGQNFIHAILNAAEAGRQLRVVTNEVANPTYTNDVAVAIGQLIETKRFGSYHLVNEGFCSRYHFARYFLDKSGYGDVSIQKISSHEWPRPSVPPEYCGLANLAGKSIGIVLRPWQEAVDAFLQEEGIISLE